MLSLPKHLSRAAREWRNDAVEMLGYAFLSVRQAQHGVLSALSGTRRHSFARPIMLGILLLLTLPAAAHVIDADLSKLSRTEVFWTYLQLGFTHILPLGFDHILFIVSLYILEPRLRPVLWQATAFTVAHSITLGMAMYGLIQPPSSIVEPIIALSILFVAVENLMITRLSPWRIAIVFGFGLVHGLGFASALTGLGLPRKDYFGSLISFNVGVELGQVSIILLCWVLVGRWAYGRPWYRARVVVPVSVIIGLVAAYWTVERLLV